MPAVFDKLGIRFQYPENWKLEAAKSAAEARTVTVFSPDGGFWTVVQHDRQEDPHQLASTALAAMRQEYAELESETVREQIEGVNLVGYDLSFYCLDLLNTTWIRAGRTSRKTYLVLCQAEDREFEKFCEVFRAMTVSLLGGSNS